MYVKHEDPVVSGVGKCAGSRSEERQRPSAPYPDGGNEEMKGNAAPLVSSTNLRGLERCCHRADLPLVLDCVRVGRRQLL
jgi:hypothetical protein